MKKISQIAPTILSQFAPVQRTDEQQRAFEQQYQQKCREEYDRSAWEEVKQGGIITFRPKKTVNQPWGKNSMPDFARFRLAVRFDNLKYAYYPSYDYNYQLQDGQQVQLYDEQLGLEKLYTLANTEKKYWNWIAISIFVNITDHWANTQEKRYNYRMITWERRKTSKNFLKLEWHKGRLDLDYMQMWVAQNNVKGYATAEEKAPWENSPYYKKSKAA